MLEYTVGCCAAALAGNAAAIRTPTMIRFMVPTAYPGIRTMERDGRQCRGTLGQEGPRRIDRAGKADFQPRPAGAAVRRVLPEGGRAIAHQKRRFERAHRNLRAQCDGDPALFAQRWTEFAQRARFDELNELIQQHNDWYPIERDLPMDLRTRDYVLVAGKNYRREPLSAEWVLRHFPASY
jgi:hypothetical protein